MSQIPETGPIVTISVSTTLFNPRQTRMGAQCSKYWNCPLSMNIVQNKPWVQWRRVQIELLTGTYIQKVIACIFLIFFIEASIIISYWAHTSHEMCCIIELDLFRNYCHRLDNTEVTVGYLQIMLTWDGSQSWQKAPTEVSCWHSCWPLTTASDDSTRGLGDVSRR